jgi:hypothetical protein
VTSSRAGARRWRPLPRWTDRRKCLDPEQAAAALVVDDGMATEGARAGAQGRVARGNLTPGLPPNGA